MAHFVYAPTVTYSKRNRVSQDDCKVHPRLSDDVPGILTSYLGRGKHCFLTGWKVFKIDTSGHRKRQFHTTVELLLYILAQGELNCR